MVTSMTAGMEDITLLQLKYQPDSEWRQMNLSLPMEGWSNWFALQFTARLLLPTGSYQKTCSVAIDEIYFTNDCGMVTSSAPDTTTALPNTTTPLQPNVGIHETNAFSIYKYDSALFHFTYSIRCLNFLPLSTTISYIKSHYIECVSIDWQVDVMSNS